jgi:hypothetical protein
MWEPSNKAVYFRSTSTLILWRRQSLWHFSYPMVIIVNSILMHIYFLTVQLLLVGQSLILGDAWRSHSDTPHSDTPHSDTPHSAGPLWKSNQPDAETSTCHQTTFTIKRHPTLRRDKHVHKLWNVSRLTWYDNILICKYLQSHSLLSVYSTPSYKSRLIAVPTTVFLVIWLTSPERALWLIDIV